MPLVFRHSFVGPQYESNSIVLVDSFSRIKIIKNIIQKLDSGVMKQNKCEKFDMRPQPAKASD